MEWQEMLMAKNSDQKLYMTEYYGFHVETGFCGLNFTAVAI